MTGIRRDAFANANRIPVEEDKPEGQRGRYLHPVAHGVSPELRIHPRNVDAEANKAAMLETGMSRADSVAADE